MTKINEVCSQETRVDEEQKEKAQEPYINVGEMELNIATKNHRAASLDPRRGRE